jgi:hypothetical protein
MTKSEQEESKNAVEEEAFKEKEKDVTYDQPLAIWEQIFKKKFQDNNIDSHNQVECILQRPETVRIPGKRIALEITKANQKMMMNLMPHVMPVVMIIMSIPFINHYVFN